MFGRPDPKGEERETWCEVVRRRLSVMFDIASESDSCGNGDPARDEAS